MKYNYYFTIMDSENNPTANYELLDSDLQFSYLRNVIYSANHNSQMCSLILESLTPENDDILNKLFDFFITLNGGLLLCKQTSQDGKETFVIAKEVLGVNLNINNGIVSTDSSTRGFSLSFKLDFREV